jgi:AraC family transcriptional regulator of adaptative response/methylated-DNA-[protein]-cysteine methyltransferase
MRDAAAIMTAEIQSGTVFSIDDDRWAAVLARDRRADRLFYYSVETTGVYCRPVCGARRPNRENVRFHESAGAAEKAGYRPCKRCRPREADRSATLVADACRLIAEAESPPSLSDLAARAKLSPFHFHRLFKAATGVTPKAYADAARADRVRRALTETPTVTAAIYESGFNSSGRFYEASAGILGMTPTRFRAGGAHETLCFGVGQCSLGAILVAASDKGVASVELGDDPQALISMLKNRFPRARLIEGDSVLQVRMAEIIRGVDLPTPSLDLPLDVRGTAFQRRVWQALRAIPPGKTASYAEIAAGIGAPSSSRAVARACAANPVAVAIPCHRVVRKDGGLAGYRWGVDRKRALLDRESGN